MRGGRAKFRFAATESTLARNPLTTLQKPIRKDSPDSCHRVTQCGIQPAERLHGVTTLSGAPLSETSIAEPTRIGDEVLVLLEGASFTVIALVYDPV